MDPLSKLNPVTDGTILLLRGAWRRGFRLFIYEPQALYWQSNGSHGQVFAVGQFVQDWPDPTAMPVLAPAQQLDLSTVKFILMRQEPPFDMGYITATYLLERLPPAVIVLNPPQAVRDAPEKLLIADWPDVSPPSLIGANLDAVQRFREAHGELVLKPLYGFGAGGIVRYQRDDPVAVLQEFSAAQNGLPFVAQAFLPEVAAGDKRVILIDGKIVGAVNREPPQGSFLANLHTGGRPVATSVTTAEAAAIAPIAAKMVKMGIMLAGLDLIGGKVTEINVTCPSALHEINIIDARTGADRMEEIFWDAVLLRYGKS
jgi:glutathione synthase